MLPRRSRTYFHHFYHLLHLSVARHAIVIGLFHWLRTTAPSTTHFLGGRATPVCTSNSSLRSRRTRAPVFACNINSPQSPRSRTLASSRTTTSPRALAFWRVPPPPLSWRRRFRFRLTRPRHRRLQTLIMPRLITINKIGSAEFFISKVVCVFSARRVCRARFAFRFLCDGYFLRLQGNRTTPRGWYWWRACGVVLNHTSMGAHHKK